MPLNYKIEQSDFKIGIWEINETEAFFNIKLGFCSLHKSVLKRLQYLASRLILKELQPDFLLDDVDDWSQNKPLYLKNYFYFNVSHTSKIAVAIISRNKNVGIDIELVSHRIAAIKSHFLNNAELEMLKDMATDNQINLISLFWTVKEAVLKWIGDSHFDYLNNMIIQGYSFESNQILHVQLNNYKIETVKVHYFKYGNYWISYCI